MYVDVLMMDELQLLVEEKELGPEILLGADILSPSDPGHHPEHTPRLEKGLNMSNILKC